MRHNVNFQSSLNASKTANFSGFGARFLSGHEAQEFSQSGANLRKRRLRNVSGNLAVESPHVFSGWKRKPAQLNFVGLAGFIVFYADTEQGLKTSHANRNANVPSWPACKCLGVR